MLGSRRLRRVPHVGCDGERIGFVTGDRQGKKKKSTFISIDRGRRVDNPPVSRRVRRRESLASPRSSLRRFLHRTWTADWPITSHGSEPDGREGLPSVGLYYAAELLLASSVRRQLNLSLLTPDSTAVSFDPSGSIHYAQPAPEITGAV